MDIEQRLKWLGLLALATFVGSLISGAVHELGHATAAVILGREVQDMQLLWIFGSPHVTYAGNVGPHGTAAICLAGNFAVVLCGLVCLFVIPFPRQRTGWAIVWALPIGGMLAQSLALVIVPVQVMFGGKPVDDVIGFMVNSKCSPMATGVGGLILVVTCASVFFWRTALIARIREIRTRPR